MSHFHIIKQNKAPEELKLIVEISKGDSNKYEYNKDYGIIELDRVLYGPMHYPVNYCDVPGTWNLDDNDPLDAVIFSTYPIAPGALATGRVVGVLEMIDNGEKDYKIITVNAKDPRYEHVESMSDLAPYEKKDIKTFFETYKIPQTGPGTVEVGDFLGTDEAYKLIEESITAYKEKFSE